MYKIFIFIYFILVCFLNVYGVQYSDLWGSSGEKWTPKSRLPDFSFAGYHSGERPIPNVEVTSNVKDFGAVGDGKTDNTAAFRKAITATANGVILIPEGKYIISDILWIEKPNIVLRGEGQGKSILHCIKDLEDVKSDMGETTSGLKTSNYSWSGGFIWVKGDYRMEPIAKVISNHQRGDNKITIDRPVNIKKGDKIALSFYEDDKGTLVRHVYSGDPSGYTNLKKGYQTQFFSKIDQVDGNKITLERPLKLDLRKEWVPEIHTFNPNIQEVGIENLSITFPPTRYRGHFTERGKNGIMFHNVSNCWVKDVQISNCDSGVYLRGSFCTIDGLLLDGSRKHNGQGFTGHHGVALGVDCLLENFSIQTRFIHDITVSKSHGNVTKNGRGLSLTLDHHRYGPYENLFTNLNAGLGRHLFNSGGGRGLGKHCAARGTFWYINSQHDIKLPGKSFGPSSINFVALNTNHSEVKEENKSWVEVPKITDFYPKDLHAAQLKARLSR